MNIKFLKIRQTRALFIIGILFVKLTASSQDICLTPSEYRFYAGAVIDKQVLKKDTARLNFAVKKLIKSHVADSLSIIKLEDVGVKYGEKEAIHTQKINLLQDDLESANNKKILNRKFAIAGWGTLTFEAILVGAYIYLKR